MFYRKSLNFHYFALPQYLIIKLINRFTILLSLHHHAYLTCAFYSHWCFYKLFTAYSFLFSLVSYTSLALHLHPRPSLLPPHPVWGAVPIALNERINTHIHTHVTFLVAPSQCMEWKFPKDRFLEVPTRGKRGGMERGAGWEGGWALGGKKEVPMFCATEGEIKNTFEGGSRTLREMLTKMASIFIT